MSLRPDWCEVLRARLQQPGRFADALPDYPPATEEQPRLTEERLGVALPPTLRRLYAEVGNGGDLFRSGVVVYGVVGGCPGFYSQGSHDAIRSLDQSALRRSGWRLSERVDRALQRHLGAFVQSEVSPDYFFTICEEGGDVAIDLDGLTGRLYHRWCGDNVQCYRISLGLPIEAGMEDAYMQAISFYAPSIEDWLEHALDNARPLFGTVIELTQEMLHEEH